MQGTIIFFNSDYKYLIINVLILLSFLRNSSKGDLNAVKDICFSYQDSSHPIGF